jgi:hypothetical protein
LAGNVAVGLKPVSQQARLLQAMSALAEVETTFARWYALSGESSEIARQDHLDRAVMFTAWMNWDQRLWREHDRRRERMLRHAQ